MKKAIFVIVPLLLIIALLISGASGDGQTTDQEIRFENIEWGASPADVYEHGSQQGMDWEKYRHEIMANPLSVGSNLDMRYEFGPIGIYMGGYANGIKNQCEACPVWRAEAFFSSSISRPDSLYMVITHLSYNDVHHEEASEELIEYMNGLYGTAKKETDLETGIWSCQWTGANHTAARLISVPRVKNPSSAPRLVLVYYKTDAWDKMNK